MLFLRRVSLAALLLLPSRGAAQKISRACGAQQFPSQLAGYAYDTDGRTPLVSVDLLLEPLRDIPMAEGGENPDTAARPTAWWRFRSDSTGYFCVDSLPPQAYLLTLDKPHDVRSMEVRVDVRQARVMLAVTWDSLARNLAEQKAWEAEWRRLKAAQALWHRKRPPAYTFTWQTGIYGFVARPIVMYRVPRSANDRTAPTFSMDSVFSLLAAALLDKGSSVSDVVYDSTFGFPRRFTTDCRPYMSDCLGLSEVLEFVPQARRTR